jgi:hypothetical protein
MTYTIDVTSQCIISKSCLTCETDESFDNWWKAFRHAVCGLNDSR